MLDAERDAVDTRRVQHPEGSARRGIGLERDLEVGRGAKQTVARSIIAPTVAGAISDGVPSPKNIERSVRGPISAAQRSISATSARPPRMVDRAAHMAVEIAIGAYGAAERPVDVDPEARIRV
jgi:hypothetical protein